MTDLERALSDRHWYFNVSPKSTATGGTSIYTVMCVVLTILKALKLIDWSWKTILIIWFAPLLVVLGLFAIFFVVILIAKILGID